MAELIGADKRKKLQNGSNRIRKNRR